MAVPRVFASFDLEHNQEHKNIFVGQGKHPSTPWEIVDCSSVEVLQQNSWEDLIKNKISKCDMVIVLVGRHMENATEVAKEIKWAQQQDIPVFGVYIDGANALSPLPEGLTRSHTIAWTWSNVTAMIEKIMEEGEIHKV
jgi:hypothetical protein